MKSSMKSFSWLSLVLLGVLFVGVTSAASGDLWNRMDNLSSDIPFGYQVDQKISINQITSSSVVITSPVIQDELGNTIKHYTVMYSQYPLSQILENASLLDQSQQKTFDFTSTSSTVSMPLAAVADSLDASKVYYVSVVPKDQNGILGEISNEIWFQLSSQLTGE